jgi:hypothetical protein
LPTRTPGIATVICIQRTLELTKTAINTHPPFTLREQVLNRWRRNQYVLVVAEIVKRLQKKLKRFEILYWPWR